MAYTREKPALTPPVEELRRAGRAGAKADAAHAGARECWRTRYVAALERMREAGIKTN